MVPRFSPFLHAPGLGLWLALGLLAAAPAAQPTDLPTRGAVGEVSSGLLYEFETRPDSSVLIRSSRGDSLRIEPSALRRISAAYGGDLTGSGAEVRSGVDIDGGDLSLYYARRIPVPVALGVFGLLTLGGIAFAVWALRRIARDDRRKTELQMYRQTLAAARERERLRIAREIHDGPLQALHALRRLLEADGHTAFEQDLLEIVRELRRVVENLRPPALDRYSLADALRSLIRRFERHNPGIEVDATLAADSDAVDAYSDELRLTLYRLTQEALNNIGAHARAHHVEIAFDARADRYALTVGDDGAGFDPERHPDDDRSHFGLLGMRERAEAVDARLTVASRPGHGTRLRLDGTPRPA
ncbi:hypothetical protein B1759_09055 [Rubrivirga sp. SAORIC476]|nr:hypothetical protein B1759_09055 [Rubrivirga sp. SAORIC476]